MDDYINPTIDKAHYEAIAQNISDNVGKSCSIDDVTSVFDLLFENDFKLATRSSSGDATEQKERLTDLKKATTRLRSALQAFPDWQRERLYNRGFPTLDHLQSLAEDLASDEAGARHSHDVQPVKSGRYAPAYVVADRMAILFVKIDVPITVTREVGSEDPGSPFAKAVSFALDELGGDGNRWRAACENAQKWVKSIPK